MWASMHKIVLGPRLGLLYVTTLSKSLYFSFYDTLNYLTALHPLLWGDYSYLKDRVRLSFGNEIVNRRG